MYFNIFERVIIMYLPKWKNGGAPSWLLRCMQKVELAAAAHLQAIMDSEHSRPKSSTTVLSIIWQNEEETVIEKLTKIPLTFLGGSFYPAENQPQFFAKYDILSDLSDYIATAVADNCDEECWRASERRRPYSASYYSDTIVLQPGLGQLFIVAVADSAEKEFEKKLVEKLKNFILELPDALSCREITEAETDTPSDK